MVQESESNKYWFNQKELIKPIDWEYLFMQPKIIQDALELYMRGEISIGKAAEMAHLPFREFDTIRAKARVPIQI